MPADTSTPDPATTGKAVSFRKAIWAQPANRHRCGYWSKISETRYCGLGHLSVRPGETVMDRYYTGFSSDMRVDAMRWRWVRLDSASLSSVDLQEVTLSDPDVIHALLENSANDVPLGLAEIVKEN